MEVPNIKKIREVADIVRDEEYKKQLEKIYKQINYEIESCSEDGHNKAIVKFWPDLYDRLNLRVVLRECKIIYKKEGYKVKVRLAFDYSTCWIFSLEW